MPQIGTYLSGILSITKKESHSNKIDSENSQVSSSELIKNGTNTDHSMSDVQANNTHFRAWLVPCLW